MAEESTDYKPPEDTETQMLRLNKQDGYEYRLRRQPDWLENYTLYRDKVIINRLIQRQSVNLPVMKTMVRTLLKDVDDLPVLYFENLDNDKEAETFKNEYWKYTSEQNKFEILDIIDKRQMFLFGRTYDQWQIVDGKVKMTIVDPQDILVSRYTDPSNIHSSRYLIHQHIFVPLAVLEANKDYDQEKIQELKMWYATKQGLIKSSTNAQMLVEKNRKMSEMGLQDADAPVLGETYVELTLNFLWHKEADGQEEEIYLFVDAEDMKVLMKKKLEDIIGVTPDHFWKTHYPYNSWADDVERQDWYSDSVGDVIRTPNKVVNSWFSQEVENRTMRNFNMHYFNNSVEGFNPQTYEPRAWGWYGVPVPVNGKIDDILKTVEIPDLNGNLDSMNFIIGMAERASGATATQQGVQTERNITLGEVQLALGEAKERTKGMSKFYTQVWKERGLMFIKLLEAAPDKIDAVTIYKKGRNTDNIYSREIAPKDWMAKAGYRCRVWSQEQKNEQDTQSLSKLNAVVANIPGNQKLQEVYQRKLLEFADISPDDINDIMKIEQDKRIAAMGAGGMTGVGNMPTQQLPAPQQQLPAPMQQIPAQVG